MVGTTGFLIHRENISKIKDFRPKKVSLRREENDISLNPAIVSKVVSGIQNI